MSRQYPLFQVDERVFERFPSYIVCCVQARGLDLGRRTQVVLDLLADAEARARISYAGEDLKDFSEIAAWRSAFSEAGWSASRFPASVEAVIKRVVRGADLPRINDAVDLANAAALFYGVPIGTHDISSLDAGPLTVRHATENDEFLAPEGGEPERPAGGEIVYACGVDVRTRRWVWRQSRTARVSDQATDIFFPIDGFRDSTAGRVEAAVGFIAHVCETSLGAEVTTALIDRNTPLFDPER